MPDWSYQTLFRPVLFRLPPERARDITLGLIGWLAARPWGPWMIEFVGHMQPPATLQRAADGLTFRTPIGIGAGLDPQALAPAALARFGVGFVEVGPVTRAPVPATTALTRDQERQAIGFPDLPVNTGVDQLLHRLQTLPSIKVPLGIRIAHQPGADPAEAAHEQSELLLRLAPHADFFVIDTSGGIAAGWSDQDWTAYLHTVLPTAQSIIPRCPVWLCLPPDIERALAERLLSTALSLGSTTVVVGGGVRAPQGTRVIGRPALRAGRELVAWIHQRWSDRITIIGSGGVHAPEDAVELLAAGATCVALCSGLVYAGPGLPKRINEALIALNTEPAPPALPWRGWQLAAWCWALLLGCGMLIGGCLAWLVAATRVVLPYDEAFVQLSRQQLAAINPRLLPFMAHDRITLAGTMISIGVIYSQLAYHGLRYGAHWAQRVLKVSAAVGFASFFLFLGFGYFDPLHAAVSLLLLPFFLLAIRKRSSAAPTIPQPDLANDRPWYAALWGQSLFVGIGLGLVLAGATIAGIGTTNVFVPEDLAFLQTTRAALQATNPRLVALIAHDRAGFGGALVSDGLAVLLMSLWGIRRGARWVWWTLCLAGLPGFAGGLGIHMIVGYLDRWHLAPAFAAMIAYIVGLALLYPYLAGSGSQARLRRAIPISAEQP
jgi:dihydroorotate dehydrogenase